MNIDFTDEEVILTFDNTNTQLRIHKDQAWDLANKIFQRYSEFDDE